MDNWDNSGDDHDSDVRIEQQLRIKIGEAKNLVPRNGSNGVRDCYCVISLDREQIYRTCATVEKTLNPFFGEEFQFEIPRRFRNLAIYVYDRERSVNNKDKVIGKVSIKRDDLHKHHNKESWFPIIPVDADSEVQGKIHLEIKLDHFPKPGAHSLPKLAVRIIDCNDLGVINGCCDPYVVVALYNGPLRQETKRTKIKKKTVDPRFDETFNFDIPIRGQNHDRSSIRSFDLNFNNLELRISVMHDGNGMFGSAFLGEVKIPLNDIDLNGHNAWYLLQPRDTCRTIDERNRTGLGSLRLKIHYTSEYVFSSRFYDPIRKLILSSPEIKPISSSTAYLLGEMVSNKVDAAQPLVKIFMHYKKIIPLIKALAESEISKVTDVNTIFRGNTLVSKCMDELMKIVGIRYLHETLRSTIEQVLTEHKTCEIDPSRLKDGESLTTNMSNLKTYISCAFHSITSSALRCPQLMCEVFTVLKELAIKYFPESREVCYYVISGFVFLRFFAPAILNPKLFEITDQQIDSQTNRTLTLISKTIQSIGNLVSSKCTNQIIKEEYMINLYKEFLTEQHIESTKVFLELISSSSTLSMVRTNESPVLLKESVMIKRAQGRRRIGIGFRNFKKRYFCLNTQNFFYAKAKNKRPLCRIPIDEILAVEKLQEQSFKMKNMFQVVRKDRALYIQASNCVEEKEWIDILTKVCQTNRNRLNEYHPSAFIGGQWLCCKSTNESASGCCPVSVISLPPDLGVHIDPDREIERIHTIFLQNMDCIETLIEMCERQHLHNSSRIGSQYSRMPLFVIEDRHTLWETLKELRQCVIRLEQNHKQYMRNVCVRTIYGSEQAPIGDDNYLLMLAKHCTT